MEKVLAAPTAKEEIASLKQKALIESRAREEAERKLLTFQNEMAALAKSRDEAQEKWAKEVEAKKKLEQDNERLYEDYNNLHKAHKEMKEALLAEARTTRLDAARDFRASASYRFDVKSSQIDARKQGFLDCVGQLKALEVLDPSFEPIGQVNFNKDGDGQYLPNDDFEDVDMEAEEFWPVVAPSNIPVETPPFYPSWLPKVIKAGNPVIGGKKSMSCKWLQIPGPIVGHSRSPGAPLVNDRTIWESLLPEQGEGSEAAEAEDEDVRVSQ